MLTDWIYEENLRPFLTALGWIVDYPFDPDDWLAISQGVKVSDGDADRWYEYEFYGRDTARFRLAHDPGSAVVHVRLEVPTAVDPQINLVLAVFQTFHDQDQQVPPEPKIRASRGGEEPEAVWWMKLSTEHRQVAAARAHRPIAGGWSPDDPRSKQTRISGGGWALGGVVVRDANPPGGRASDSAKRTTPWAHEESPPGP